MPTVQTIIAVLTEARRLLSEKGWTKFQMARDSSGRAVSLDSLNAACYCLGGALTKAWRIIDPQNEEFYFRYFQAEFSTILKELYNYDYTFTRWGDDVAASKDDVISLIDYLIKTLS
jgi:hypothetical protein